MTDKNLAARRKLARDIHIWNMASQIADAYEKETRKAGAPMVGIFWFDSKGKVHGFGEPLRDAEEHGDFRICRRDHYETWHAIEEMSPEFKDKEYEDVDRGRITYDVKREKFVVYLPKEYQAAKMAKARRNINSYFNLPREFVEYDYTDEHYQKTEWR